MSFPRARIQRFNDQTSCAPPPGRYDPKFEAKVKGAVIEKSGRFVEPKCPSVSGNSAESPANGSLTSSSSKSASMNCLPVFRTPQLPRRVAKPFNSASQVKTKLKYETSANNETAAKEISTELYEALIVDRDNKDATIRENEAHIDELYERIRNLERDLQQLQSAYDALVQKNKIELEEKNKELLRIVDVKPDLEKVESELSELREKCVVLEKSLSESETVVANLEEERDNLLANISELEKKEEESKLRHETDIKQMNVLCKKLTDLANENEKKKLLEQEAKDLKKELSKLREINSDLDSKLNQKQCMILMIQSELSSAELELEELKSENEKIIREFNTEKVALREAHISEIESLEENVLNSSIMRENLETIISDKQSALAAMNDKYLALEAEFEKSCMEQKLVTEAHRLEMDEICHRHERELNEVREKAEEEVRIAEKKINLLNDKYFALEADFEKSCIEQNLITEAHRLEMNEIFLKHDEELSKMREEANKKERELEERLTVLKDKLSDLESEFEKTCTEHKLLVESHTQEIEEMNIKHENELSEVKDKANEKMKEMEKKVKEIMEISAKEIEERVMEVRTTAEENLNEVRNTAEKKIKEFEVEAAARIKDCEIRVEVKLREAEQEMHESLEKANQAEEELRCMTHYRDELRISNMENQLTIVDLQDKIDTLVTELNTAKETYEEDLIKVRNKHNTLEKQCKTLKIGNSNLQASLEALQRRLLESEHYVEQLTNSSQLIKSQKEALEEQVKTLTEKLEANKLSMTQLESDTVQQIEETRKELLSKLEEFKVKADKNITAKEEEILEHRHKAEGLSAKIFELTETLSAVEDANTEHEREIEALTEKLDHQRDCAQIATQQIANLEASNAIYQHQIQALTAELEYQKDFSQKASDHIAALAAAKASQEKAVCVATDRITELVNEVASKEENLKEYREKIDELLGDIEAMKISQQDKLDSELMLKLADMEEHYQRLMSKADAKAALAEDWERRFKEMETLIGPFREQLEAFDAERKALELQKEAAEVELRDLGLRFAEILGHQNHKQKIKHVMKLKEQNYELKKEIEKLESQVRSQKRLIDKLKDEQRATAARKTVLHQHNSTSVTGKENVDHSPIRKSPVSSPNMKPLRKYR
ncbi:myosin-11-like isoform X2 [Periplaneta americana]|uniref:myosin-11-like isoform X2 n=1 Tax=Periplaneta americana TaxID=6978 RepID=UPI0037E9AEB5